jgi:hypothetical protein
MTATSPPITAPALEISVPRMISATPAAGGDHSGGDLEDCDNQRLVFFDPLNDRCDERGDPFLHFCEHRRERSADLHDDGLELPMQTIHGVGQRGGGRGILIRHGDAKPAGLFLQRLDRCPTALEHG